MLPKFNSELKVLADEQNVEFVDATRVCGAPVGGLSEEQYFIDPIHLNPRGYCKLWTQPSMQTILGCGTESYDCSQASTAGDGDSSSSAKFLPMWLWVVGPLCHLVYTQAGF